MIIVAIIFPPKIPIGKKGKVIDFGCGSGILAVAAVLLGAKEAHAIDIDPQALIATKDNAEKNKENEFRN